MLNLLSFNFPKIEFISKIKTKIRTNEKFLALSLSDVVFILLINVKMPTIVGILTFKSSKNFVLSWVEYEKFYNIAARM